MLRDNEPMAANNRIPTGCRDDVLTCADGRYESHAMIVARAGERSKDK